MNQDKVDLTRICDALGLSHVDVLQAVRVIESNHAAGQSWCDEIKKLRADVKMLKEEISNLKMTLEGR